MCSSFSIDAHIKPPSKVRVTFFESEKPYFVSSPDSGETPPLEFDIPVMSSPSPNQEKPGYNRQESTESGKDNPFRPDGDLSREADEIVELIKGGRPFSLTPTKESPPLDGDLSPADSATGHDELDGGIVSPKSAVVAKGKESPIEKKYANAVLEGEKQAGANGNAPTGVVTPEAVEVQHGIVVPPSDAAQVEHVVLKKKPKCKCCVVM